MGWVASVGHVLQAELQTAGRADLVGGRTGSPGSRFLLEPAGWAESRDLVVRHEFIMSSGATGRSGPVDLSVEGKEDVPLALSLGCDAAATIWGG